MDKRILVAMGGNAIKQRDEEGTFEEQIRNIEKTCRHLLGLMRRDYDLVITHGNGPQVGALMIQNEEANSLAPPQPMDVLGAMTQGQIGYMIQQTLTKILREAGIERPVATIITQVLVDKEDEAFKNPLKPIGPFYSKGMAEKLAREKSYQLKKVLPRGRKPYRRVVPSPDPIRAVEGTSIRNLVDSGVIVIASGGGGVPVAEEAGGHLRGLDAVIDKDLAGERLAEVIDADTFLILTDVEKVKLNFGRPDERPIDKMTLKEAKKYMEKGHFLPGSMGPKVLACIRFIEWGGKEAIITSLDRAIDALNGKAGTLISRD